MIDRFRLGPQTSITFRFRFVHKGCRVVLIKIPILWTLSLWTRWT